MKVTVHRSSPRREAWESVASLLSLHKKLVVRFDSSALSVKYSVDSKYFEDIFPLI